MLVLDEIRDLIVRHTERVATSPVWPGVRLSISEAPTARVNSVYRPAFALVAQGAKRTLLGDRLFEYGAGQYLVVSADLPIASQVVQASAERPYLAFAWDLNPASIATLLLEIADNDRGSMLPATALAISLAPMELLDSIARLLRLFDRPRDIAVLGPLLEREILWHLLTGAQGRMIRQIGLVDSRLAQVNRAIGWIRAHYAELLSVDTLAKITGMGASTFYRHFRAVTALSPLQYQKRIRLHVARTRLIADARDVATVGFEVGYESASQFSREYSRLFGAPPGKDVRRLRSGMTAESAVL